MERKYYINKWAVSNPRLYPVLEVRAKQMRVAMAEAEKIVWEKWKVEFWKWEVGNGKMEENYE